MQLSEDIRQRVLLFQRTEITESHIYKRVARRIKSVENAKILDQIADDELHHYNIWKDLLLGVKELRGGNPSPHKGGSL